MRHCNEMIMDPACQMQRIAPHPDFAVDDLDRGRHGVEFAANPVGHPEYGHDCPFDERDRLRQGIEARRDPSALRRQKAQTGARRDAARQNQFDRAFGRVDPQPYPSRPRADPDRDRNANTRIEVRGNQPLVAAQAQCLTPLPRTCK